VVRFEGFELDLRTAELRRSGEPLLKLSEQPFQILAMLLERRGDLVTREEIRSSLWPNGTIVEFEHSINAAINRLRLVLGDSAENPRFVETLARRGYRWMVPVQWSEATPAQQPSPAVPPSSLESFASNLIGRKVSHYRVLQVLGCGGMGVVYQAEDLKLGRRVALKFLPEELAHDPVAMQRFEREARAASALNHSNICTIFEVEEYEGQPFIVMELLEGRTLREWIPAQEISTAKDQPVPLPTLLDIALQITAGLEAAHSKGIIHRDIKPANIFVTTSSQVKILDFGLAQLQESETSEPEPGASETPHSSKVWTPYLTLTRTGTPIGTAGYMSPEQIRGEKLDARTDLFNLGLVLYEMAAGRRAFTGETAPILQDAILNGTPEPVRQLHPQIPPNLEGIIIKALEKDRNLRYQSAAEVRADLQRLKRDLGAASEASRFSPAKTGTIAQTRLSKRRKILISLAALLVAGLVAWKWRSISSVSRSQLTSKDKIVLGDFSNSTGDPIFDDTLRFALRSSLQQSPFLNILSDRRASAALASMTLPPDTRLTPGIAREVCVRVQSKAYMTGAIAALGSAYVIELKAVNCASGSTLARQQVNAESKEDVLKALDNAASRLREQLGESLASVAKFDITFDQTTRSLEALREYNMAVKISGHDLANMLPHLLRAIQIDPDFTYAYLVAGDAYDDMNQNATARKYFTRAFELREHATMREKLEIESIYYATVTGELDKAAQIYRQSIESYPNSAYYQYGNLGYVYAQQGQYENALECARKVLQLVPDFGGLAYDGIAQDLLALHHFEDARQILQTALDRKLDTDGVHKDMYGLGFVSGDSRVMSEQVAWLESKPAYANLGLSLESDTTAYAGQFRKARVLTDHAVDAAAQTDNKEIAALWLDHAALREAMVGHGQLASQYAQKALRIVPSSQHVQIESALALAMVPESPQARSLAQRLAKDFPLDTRIQSKWLPTIEAELALAQKNPEAAIDRLRDVTPTELGAVSFHTSISCLYPVYVRGEAYLAAGKGNAAAGEFQRILDHAGIVWNCPTGALAHLGLARANVLEARTDQGVAADAARTRARNAYQDFFTLWKDADPDIPILKQAKSEYAKLQ
jgi:serine/threonine protein kinase/tetratricopeptide (TPR) repeat protein